MKIIKTYLGAITIVVDPFNPKQFRASYAANEGVWSVGNTHAQAMENVASELRSIADALLALAGKEPQVINPIELADKLAQVERLVDNHPTLTRERKGVSRARFVVTAETAPTIDDSPVCWTVQLEVRGTLAKGRGSRSMTTVSGSGPNPGAAVLAFHESLNTWQEVLK